MNDYEEIIGLPRPQSKYPRMSSQDRAAQFSPFAALKGYEEEIEEAGRETEEWVESDDSHIARIGETLTRLRGKKGARVGIVCFVWDEKKEGGRYRTLTGELERIDETRREIVLSDGEHIPFFGLKELEEL